LDQCSDVDGPNCHQLCAGDDKKKKYTPDEELLQCDLLSVLSNCVISVRIAGGYWGLTHPHPPYYSDPQLLPEKNPGVEVQPPGLAKPPTSPSSDKVPLGVRSAENVVSYEFYKKYALRAIVFNITHFSN